MRLFAENSVVKALDPVADRRQFFSKEKHHFKSEYYNIFLIYVPSSVCVRMMQNEITNSGLHGLPCVRRLTDPVRFVHKKMTGAQKKSPFAKQKTERDQANGFGRGWT